MRSTVEARIRRHESIRKKVKGTPERPRLSVYRSLDHNYAQIIDESAGGDRRHESDGKRKNRQD